MNRIYHTTILFLLLTLHITPQLFPSNIIFDLGGVLLVPNKSAMAMKAGPLSLAGYALSHMENPRTAFYNILNTIDPYTHTTVKPYDENGTKLPEIMCDWLKGVPSKKILGAIEQAMTTSHTLWPLATAIFEPKFMASAQQLVKNGKKFVQECIEQGHCVYILSNWDAESFTYLQEKYPEFFGLFSGIIISGDCKLLKPDPSIFKHLLFTYNLDEKTCFFIDNQIENVTAASTIGISGSVVENDWRGRPDFKKVRTDLHAWIKQQLQYV